VRSYLRSLEPRLPPPVRALPSGGFVNAFGNDGVFRFVLIDLQDVRGIGLATAGLAPATSGIASPVFGPHAGAAAAAVPEAA